MSNTSALNLSVSGTCAISGTVSLSQPLISGSTCSIQGITTTDLTTTGNVLFNTLPISNILPTTSNQLITKSYADGLNLVQSSAIAALVGRADTNDALNTVQDNRILGCETVNTNQATSITAIVGVNTTQNTNITALQTRATAIEGVNTTQNTNITALQTRATAIEAVNTTQNTNITALQTRATAIETVNTNQATSLTAIEAVNTTQNTNITALQTRATAIETVNTNQATSITNIDNLNITQNNRLLAVENINTNQSTALTNINVLNTTQNNRITACETVNTNQATSITAIEAVNTTQGTSITALETRATVIETINTNQDVVNTTQNTNITALQQKTTPIVYTVPATGALKSLTSSLDILPYVSSTFLKVYNINNQAITCLGQAIFGGLGLITTRLQLTNFGTIMTGLAFGNNIGVVGNNVVNFPASTFSGFIIPRVLISPSGNGVFFVVSRTLTSFTYSASVAGVNIDWIALQSV